MGNNPPTLIIDSMSICHRVKHALCDPNKPGQQGCAIIGFLDTIQQLIDLFSTDDVVFAWDSRKSVRKKMFPKYQYKRHDNSKKTPKEIAFDKLCHHQFNFIKYKLIPSMGFNNNFLQTGYEADDIVAHIVKSYSQDKYKFVVVTVDQDYYQLLDYTDIFDPWKKVLITVRDFWNQYRLRPNQWVDYKAIAGCKSDKVPGIKGVGEKSALHYLQGSRYLVKEHILKKIENGSEQREFCRKLVELPYPGTKLFKLNWNSFHFKPMEQVCINAGVSLPIKTKSFWLNLLEDIL
jgi:DNA polymerase-1